MPTTNEIIVIGRLGQDPEMRYTPSGVAVATFSLAVNRDFKDANGERQTDWFRCKAWRKQAETVAQYLRKGRQVLVRGAMQSYSYTGQDGQERKGWEINVSHFEFLGPKPQDDEANTVRDDAAAADEALDNSEVPF